MGDKMMKHVLHVVGARPNFMKAAPVIRALKENGFRQTLVHTGQHYDEKMSEVFFKDLGLPRPDLNLGVGSGSHAFQTAQVMLRLEPHLTALRPDMVLVYGDVNSTTAAALTASKMGITVGHVEAGLRSGDRSMPEELNRIVTDHLSDYLFTPSMDGNENLAREGVPESKVFFVGNVMIDSLLSQRERSRHSKVLEWLELAPRRYSVCTLHRPSNVDEPETLFGILSALIELGREYPVIFPAHPRTVERMKKAGLSPAGVRVIEPLGYIDFMRLVSEASLVLTDSGGLQEETTVLGIPCVTIRENTERPVTIERGTNVLAGVSKEGILAAAAEAREKAGRGLVPEKWDGFAGRRIAEVLMKENGYGIRPQMTQMTQIRP